MDLNQAQLFLRALRARNIRARGRDTVIASCPLARWTHRGSNVDTSPSFAVILPPGKPAYFNCFACTHGSLADLLQYIDGYAHADSLTPADTGTLDARAVLEDAEANLKLPEWQQFQHAHEPFQAWPEWYLDAFPAVWKFGPAREYITAGRIADGNQPVAESVAADFDIRVDWERRMVVAPIRTVGGRLAGLRGRAYERDRPKEFRHHDYTWNDVNNTSLVWYNERALSSTAPVIVVEGQFDVWNVAQVYPHVVGILSSKITDEKMKKLLQAEFTLFMMDNDGTGLSHQPEYMAYLQRQNRLTGAIAYEGKDPAKVDPQWLREQLHGVVPLA